MDFSLTDEQEQMQASAESFVEDRELIELARRASDGEDVADEAWEALVAMDYPALTVPVEHGGLGDGMVYLAILLEALGRAALPAPFAETAAFAAPLIDAVGDDDQRERYLPRIADGEHRYSVALYGTGTEALPEDVAMRTAPGDDGRAVLDGEKVLVPYGTAVEKLVVAARPPDGDGVATFLVDAGDDGVSARRGANLDPTRPAATVRFDGAPAERLGAGESLEAALDRLRLAYCASMLGAADRAVELSAEHGRTREQYGNPVGMYQAVKHRVADMWMDGQAARSLTYYAAWAVDDGDPDAPRAVSAAKAFCGDVMPRIFGDDVQNHGAMGFTTDHDAHLYLKRAKLWRTYLGDSGAHYDRVADERGL